MRWNLHGLIVEGITHHHSLEAYWQKTFASRPLAADDADPDLRCSFEVIDAVPPPPDGQPHFRQGELLQYFLDGGAAIAHFPRFGQLRLDLASGITAGQIVLEALGTYGVFEDLVAIGLSPHLRRRGMFLLHAFAAAAPVKTAAPQAALIVGGIGSGKTTTGMALLEAGWKLLSNDSPIIHRDGRVLSYPGLLAAYPDTYARFAVTAHLAAASAQPPGKKLTVAAGDIWPGVWIDHAAPAIILFPAIEQRADHLLEPLAPAEALRRLLPNAIEQWDKGLIAEHLRVLKQVIEAARAFVLRLAPHTNTIPALLEEAIGRR